MGELLGGIPRVIKKEVQQLRNVGAAYQEINALSNKPERFQRLVLLGFSSIIPNQVKESGILNNPLRIEAVDALEQYQIALNDEIDVRGSNRSNFGELIQEAGERKDRRRERLDSALSKLPKDEQIRAKNIIETGVREVEFVENWIREKRDVDKVSFTEVDIYRNIVNSISNVAISSIIFGPGSLEDRVKPVEGVMDIQSIIDKYAWVVGRSPKNEIERGVMVSHNIAMIVQTINDWRGRDYDRRLNIPSYATATLRSYGGIEGLARSALKSEEEKYKQRAYELGLGKLATEGSVTFSSVLVYMHKFAAKKIRDHDWIRQRVTKWPLGFREKAYAQRKI